MIKNKKNENRTRGRRYPVDPNRRISFTDLTVCKQCFRAISNVCKKKHLQIHKCGSLKKLFSYSLIQKKKSKKIDVYP